MSRSCDFIAFVGATVQSRRSLEVSLCVGNMRGHRQEVGRPVPRGRPIGHDRPLQLPHRSPYRLPQRRELRIVKVRFCRQWGPHRIAAHLHLRRSTVEAVLRRYRMPLLRHLDQNTCLPVRRPVPRRYERAAPGDLVHLDVKKLGRIPDGGGHRKVGRRRGPDGLHGRFEHPVI